MNILNQTELIENLTKVQRTLCVYDGFPDPRYPDRKRPSFCDCKFGAENVGKMTETGCGCPEVANAVVLLSLLTKKEYKQLVDRHKDRIYKLTKMVVKSMKKARGKNASHKKEN